MNEREEWIAWLKASSVTERVQRTTEIVRAANARGEVTDDDTSRLATLAPRLANDVILLARQLQAAEAR